MEFPVYTSLKGDTYKLILVMIDWLIKMVCYKIVKVIIDSWGLAKLFLDVIVQRHNLLKSIVNN